MQPVWLLTDQRYAAQRMPGALAAGLRARGVDARMVLAERVAPQPVGAPPWRGLCAGDTVVTRSRSPWALVLLGAAERHGVVSVVAHAAIEAARDKAAAAALLAQADVPAPPTWLAGDVEALRALPAGAYPLLLKPRYGDNAHGIRLIRRPEDLPPIGDEAVVVAQRYVDVAGVDLKLYVAGSHVWAVRRPSPLTGSTAPGHLVPVDGELHGLARMCADTFGLMFAGVDVLAAPDGPLVVDVNDFPNYTGVREAPAVLADLVVRANAGGGTELVA